MTKKNGFKDMLNITQAADHIGITVRQLRYHQYKLQNGPKPIFLSARKMFYKKEVLDAWRKKYLAGEI